MKKILHTMAPDLEVTYKKENKFLGQKNHEFHVFEKVLIDKLLFITLLN